MKIENLGGKMRDLMPEYNRWLGSLEEDYRGRAIPLGSLTFREANRYFPDYVLSDSLIIRTNRFPTPPFAELGIPELAYMDSTPLNGVTYGKLIFIDPKKECMRLVFHESVHIAQGYFLGYDDFHLAYGLSILSDTYDENPFERVAYDLEAQFQRNELIPNMLEYIKSEAVKAWEKLKGLIA